METNNELNKSELDEQIKELEKKYNVEITYVDNSSIKDKLISGVAIVAVLVAIVGGTFFAVNKHMDYSSQKYEQKMEQSVRYEPVTREILCNNKRYDENKICLLFNFEEKTKHYCVVDYDVKSDDGEYYNIYTDIETGKEIFKHNHFNKDSESYKMVENKKISILRFDDIYITYNRYTKVIDDWCLNVDDPDYLVFDDVTIQGRHK